MNRCFLIAGPESAGNRLLASIFVRAGCHGEGSASQFRTVADLPSGDVVWIKHRHVGWHYESLIVAGYQVTVLVIVREWFANIASLQERHGYDEDAAASLIRRRLASIFSDVLSYGIPAIVLTYAGLQRAQLVRMLQSFGLRTDNLDEPLTLPGQAVPLQPEPLATNRKHYQVEPCSKSS